MSVMTVNGWIEDSKLGIIAPHEHLLIDFRSQFSEFKEVSKKYLSEQKVSIENLDIISMNPWAVKDNWLMGDTEVAKNEVQRFKEAGGETIVDVTSVGLGRDPEAIRNIGNSVGLNTVMGCGYYTKDSHPKDMDEKTVEDIYDEMMRDIKIGVADTGIKAGVIGEIGTSEEIYPNEKKALIAASKVQKDTGLAIHIHTYSWGQKGLEALDIVEKNGANLNKVCIDHVDLMIDIKYCEKIIKRGAYIEFENFQKEWTGDGIEFCQRDLDKIEAIIKLTELGYISSILISGDICLKMSLHKYGGWGYDHVLNNIIPIMRRKGVTKEQIDKLIKEGRYE